MRARLPAWRARCWARCSAVERPGSATTAPPLDATPTSRLVVRKRFDCIPVGVPLGGGDRRTPGPGPGGAVTKKNLPLCGVER
jgi:hypothetical protein